MQITPSTISLLIRSAQIYRNEITNWSEVGGPNRMINPVTRVTGSGSQSMMDRFMEDNMLTARRIRLSIFGHPSSICSATTLRDLSATTALRCSPSTELYPDAESIRNGTYPLTVNFYVVYRADNDNPNVQMLVDWLLSEEGQHMIEQTGYVGLN